MKKKETCLKLQLNNNMIGEQINSEQSSHEALSVVVNPALHREKTSSTIQFNFSSTLVRL